METGPRYQRPDAPGLLDYLAQMRTAELHHSAQRFVRALPRVRGRVCGMGRRWQYAPTGRIFVGRAPELDTLAQALATARAGEPQVVLVEGEAGFGKSSLVFEFLDRHRDVPAALRQRRGGRGGIGLWRSAAIRGRDSRYVTWCAGRPGADGPGVRSADADPLAVGMELLTLLSSLQGKRAAAVVVEDLQWADLPSARALLFACRRLRLDRVLVILTCRPGGVSQLGEGWARFVSGDHRASAITLSGLGVEELGMLCRG